MCVKDREKDINAHRTYLECKFKNKIKKDVSDYEKRPLKMNKHTTNKQTKTTQKKGYLWSYVRFLGHRRQLAKIITVITVSSLASVCSFVKWAVFH